MSDDDMLDFFKTASTLSETQIIDALVAMKTHSLAGIRKTAKKALERCAPSSLSAMSAVFKGKLTEDPAKFAKKFASIDATLLGVDVVALAQAFLAKGAAALFFLMIQGGEVAKAAMQASLLNMHETMDPEPNAVLRPTQGLLVLDGYKNEIPASIKDVRGLKALSLFGCGIKEIPAPLFALKELEFLNLMDNRIKRLPDEMQQMKKLRILLMRKAPLTEGIGNLPALEEFCIYHETKLADLSSLLIPSLQVLQIHESPKLILGDHFKNAASLRSLSMGTPISDLPPSFFELKKLTELQLRFLGKIPERITELTSLRRLNVNFSKVDALPPGIEKLTSLEDLDISWTSISDIKPLYSLSLKSLDTGYCYELDGKQRNEFKQKSPKTDLRR